MEVVDDSHGHLGDQRVPPSTGSVPFHHDGSLDSAYEENFECGEEAIQRRLLISRILSSPLLFCASASSSPDAPTLISSCSGVDAHSSVSFSSDEDTEDTTNTLEVSRTETEEYELGSSPLKRASLENEEQVEDLIEKPVNNNNNSDEDIWNNISSNCDNYNNENAVKIDLTHQKAIHGIRRSQVARVIQEIVDRIVVINETITTESPTIDTECDDECLESDIPCLSWRNRRPMSGRSISTDSGISSVDDSRLSHTSSDYAASPAAVSDSSDEVRTQEKKTRRRSARLEAETPAPKQLRTSSNALKSCATPKSTSPSSKITSTRSSSPNSSKKGCSIQNTRSVTALNVQTTTGYLQTRSSLSSSKPSSSSTHSSVGSAKNVACRWKDCLFVAAKDNDLADHIADAHVEPQGEKASFVCLWESCKVFNVPSTLKHWLEQHVVKHSRSKPLKCIVDGCPQRFSTKPLLQAHVNSHFEKNPKLKNESALKNQQLLKLAKRKRLLRQNSKMQAGRKYDFFDAYIMHQIKERLLQSAERTTDRQMPPSSTSPSSSSAASNNEIMKSSSIMTRSSCPLNSASASEPLRNRRKRSSSRRNVALTNELNDEVASSPDSGCSSLRETDGVQTLVRAIRELPSGQRQMLISYYKPRTELISVVEPPDHS